MLLTNQLILDNDVIFHNGSDTRTLTSISQTNTISLPTTIADSTI